jgi:K+-sensing histidine kinase KdpD
MKLEIEETLPCERTIRLSQQAIELMLWEVLENARKFHPRQEPRVEMSIFAADAHSICIRVCDDGMTLSPQQLAYAWMPYYQGEKEFTGEVPGIGLGLASVASLLWQAGGSCHIANRPAAPGVVIELYLPLSDADAPHS